MNFPHLVRTVQLFHLITVPVLLLALFVPKTKFRGFQISLYCSSLTRVWCCITRARAPFFSFTDCWYYTSNHQYVIYGYQHLYLQFVMLIRRRQLVRAMHGYCHSLSCLRRTSVSKFYRQQVFMSGTKIGKALKMVRTNINSSRKSKNCRSKIVNCNFETLLTLLEYRKDQ